MSPEHPTVKAARQAVKARQAAHVELNQAAAAILAVSSSLAKLASQPDADTTDADVIAAVKMLGGLTVLVDKADTAAGRLARLRGITYTQLGEARGQKRQNARVHYRRKGIDQ